MEKEKLTREEKIDKFKKWLRWAWWEILLCVFALLMLHWFLINLDIVDMTVTENGQVISTVEPTIRNYDYWSAESYLSGPASRLPLVTCSGDVTVELDYGFLTPNRADATVFSVSDIDSVMANPAIRSETVELDSDYRSGTLTFDVDADTAVHQVIVANAYWYGILGQRHVQYVFLLSNADS